MIYFSYRCVQDETLKIYPSNQTSFMFGVETFKFTGNYDQVILDNTEYETYQTHIKM